MTEKPTTAKLTIKRELQVKFDRAHAARMNAEEFIVGGGDLSSKEALLIGHELTLAANDLAAEFGYAPVPATK